MQKYCRMPMFVLVLAIAPVTLAESFLMGFDEYMARCMSAYGEDKVTQSVCENQYRAIEKKEQEIVALNSKAEGENWQSEKINKDVVKSSQQ